MLIIKLVNDFNLILSFLASIRNPAQLRDLGIQRITSIGKLALFAFGLSATYSMLLAFGALIALGSHYDFLFDTLVQISVLVATLWCLTFLALLALNRVLTKKVPESNSSSANNSPPSGGEFESMQYRHLLQLLLHESNEALFPSPKK